MLGFPSLLTDLLNRSIMTSLLKRLRVPNPLQNNPQRSDGGLQGLKGHSPSFPLTSSSASPAPPPSCPCTTVSVSWSQALLRTCNLCSFWNSLPLNTHGILPLSPSHLCSNAAFPKLSYPGALFHTLLSLSRVPWGYSSSCIFSYFLEHYLASHIVVTLVMIVMTLSLSSLQNINSVRVRVF